MALSITASNVVPGANATLNNATAGEAITAGMPIVVVAGVAYKTNNAGNDRAGACHGIAARAKLRSFGQHGPSSSQRPIGFARLLARIPRNQVSRLGTVHGCCFSRRPTSSDRRRGLPH